MTTKVMVEIKGQNPAGLIRRIKMLEGVIGVSQLSKQKTENEIEEEIEEKVKDRSEELKRDYAEELEDEVEDRFDAISAACEKEMQDKLEYYDFLIKCGPCSRRCDVEDLLSGVEGLEVKVL